MGDSDTREKSEKVELVDKGPESVQGKSNMGLHKTRVMSPDTIEGLLVTGSASQELQNRVGITDGTCIGPGIGKSKGRISMHSQKSKKQRNLIGVQFKPLKYRSSSSGKSDGMIEVDIDGIDCGEDMEDEVAELTINQILSAQIVLCWWG